MPSFPIFLPTFLSTFLPKNVTTTGILPSYRQYPHVSHVRVRACTYSTYIHRKIGNIDKLLFVLKN